MDAMVEIDNLTKQYGDHLAVDHLTLGIAPGEIFSLLGANGAGKTTTINLLLNFVEPTSGRAAINGLDVVGEAKEVKRHVAYLSENVMLYGNMTARQKLHSAAARAARRGTGDLYEHARRISGERHLGPGGDHEGGAAGDGAHGGGTGGSGPAGDLSGVHEELTERTVCSGNSCARNC